jgi:hypothetical protein
MTGTLGGNECACIGKNSSHVWLLRTPYCTVEGTITYCKQAQVVLMLLKHNSTWLWRSYLKTEYRVVSSLILYY